MQSADSASQETPAARRASAVRYARTLAQTARARVTNAWMRLGSNTIVAFFAVQVAGAPLPIYWYAGAVLVLILEARLNVALARRCEAGHPPRSLVPMQIWTVFQSAFGNSLAAILWFSDAPVADTLAIIYLIAGLANAVATLRRVPALGASGAIPTALFLIGLPVIDLIIAGGADMTPAYQVIGAVMFLGFGANIWISLRRSDLAEIAAEAALAREKQAVASAAQAKSLTISRVIDEMRTPLAALSGATENMRRALATPEARSHGAAILEAQAVLHAALDDLRDLDTIENDKLKIEPKPCDPRELVRGVIGAFRVTAHDKGLELFLDIAENVPAGVRIDALRVRQILFNLISNAIRFTPNGGVRVKLQAQEGAEPGQVRLGFLVADTGPGMSRSQLALIFSRTPDGGHSQGERGAGLGLSISLRLARLMGAKLGARSELGAGSVFSLIIDAPIVRATTGARSAA